MTSSRFPMHDKAHWLGHACTCGKHKVNKAENVSDAPLETATEYSDHYHPVKIEVRRGKAAPQELTVGGEFYGSTENREKYKVLAIPPRYQIAKPVYQPDPAKLESMTTQRANFQPHLNVQPPKRRERPQWQSTSGTFNGASTTKTDYTQFPLPPHYVHPHPPYVKSEAKMEGVSTQNEDYKPWEIKNVPTRRKPAVPASISSEDRDFKSTTNASYVYHQVHTERVRAPQTRTTDSSVKMEGVSTTKEAYKSWELPPHYKRHLPEYVPNPAPLDGTSTYKGTYVPKTAKVYVHPTPVYVPNEAKFEGQSTNKTDFLPTGKIVRPKDYAPRNQYAAVSDDRDFVSTTRGAFVPKQLPQCPAVEWMDNPVRPQTGIIDH
ncbi:hypothetical protein EDD86DRAFT_275398 [Gorgonomyces haynaldii]|nr:hypothetical protein EDD86DRAFT_275398 [Gorgonomyces haynaldii]